MTPLQRIWRLARRGGRPEYRYGLDDYLSWVNAFGFNGTWYGLGGAPTLIQTISGETVEPPDNTYLGLARQSFAGNAVVFACMALRQHVLSGMRFQWQQLNSGRPSKLFGTSVLELLERPWPGGTTQDLLARMDQDAGIAGTCYQFVDTALSRLGGDGGQEIVRMRPDWVDVVSEARMVTRNGRAAQIGYRKLGYIYTEGGRDSGIDPAVLGADEMSMFSPYPDPLARWRGMSWLTPVIREIEADGLMTSHRRKFFENGATPNMVVKYPIEAKLSQIRELKKLLDTEHAGVENAYKRLHIGRGADVTVVGTDFQKMTFKDVQGAGETRIAAAAGTPPVLVGLSEGLQGSSLNEGNYAMARRRMADITAHPWWKNAAGSLEVLFTRPGAGVRLWYDPRESPFLREDEKDQASIAQLQAATMRALIDAGYTPDSVKASILANDWALLEHSGLFSVQLQQPGSGVPPPAALPALNGSGTSKLPVGK